MVVWHLAAAAEAAGEKSATPGAFDVDMEARLTDRRAPLLRGRLATPGAYDVDMEVEGSLVDVRHCSEGILQLSEGGTGGGVVGHAASRQSLRQPADIDTSISQNRAANVKQDAPPEVTRDRSTCS